MTILNAVRRHIDEAAYLYDFSHSLPEGVTITWFLLKKKHMQLRKRLDPHVSLNEDALISLYGARHVVDLLGSEIYILDEIYRERVYDRIADFGPKPGSTVVDVGANVGMFAVQRARRGAYVYAFEPNPDCYRRLSRAVVENGLTDRISIFNYAIGQGSGFGTMRVPNNRTALGSVIPLDTDTSGPSHAIKIISLDQTLPALGVEYIDLLKIDTEGAELAVLQGAQRMLEVTQRIIVEYHSRDLQHRVGMFFSSRGFRQVLHLDTPSLPETGVIYARKSHADGE